jgi:hypothetical protein
MWARKSPEEEKLARSPRSSRRNRGLGNDAKYKQTLSWAGLSFLAPSVGSETFEAAIDKRQKAFPSIMLRNVGRFDFWGF